MKGRRDRTRDPTVQVEHSSVHQNKYEREGWGMSGHGPDVIIIIVVVIIIFSVDSTTHEGCTARGMSHEGQIRK